MQDENRVFAYFRLILHLYFLLHHDPTHTAAQPYTMKGFVQDLQTKPYTPNPSDYQTLKPNCVGFEGNACTLEKRIGVKGENARLAREAYFTFFPALLFERILAQVLLQAPTQ